MLTVKIKTENAAFVNDRIANQKEVECARILRTIADDLIDGERDRHVYDIHGNRVGEYKLTNR